MKGWTQGGGRTGERMDTQGARGGGLVAAEDAASQRCAEEEDVALQQR